MPTLWVSAVFGVLNHLPKLSRHGGFLLLAFCRPATRLWTWGFVRLGMFLSVAFVCGGSLAVNDHV